MLKLLRKKGVAKKVIWVIAIVIIFSFGFFGTAYLITGNSTSDYAGKIYGKKISIEDFNKVYQNTRIQAIRQYGYNLNKVAHLLNLEAQTWDRIVLLDEAKKRKIKVPNDAIIKSIEADESFQKNGQFDVLLYNAILRNLRIRPRDYEENVRDNLKISALYNEATSSLTISEEDVFREYQHRNEKIQTSYVFVTSESFKNEVTLETSEVEQYFQDHMTEFQMPAAVNVQYLTFDFPDPVSGSADPEDASEDDNEDKEDALEQEKGLIREKADAVFEQLLINPDMETIARQNNMPVQTSGFFSMEQPILTLGWSYDLLNKIFQMDLDEVNEPFETNTGLAIIQIKEKRDSYIPEFSEGQEKAREAVTDLKAKEIAQQKADEYLEAIREELGKSKLQDFPKAAKALGLEIYQTPVFNRGQYLPQVGISKEFEEEAFALTEDNKLSNVVEIAKGYCILHLDNKIPVDTSTYEKEKEALAEEISADRKGALFGDFIMQLRQKAGLEDNISNLQSGTQ